jgi:NADPH2 dehydrogenase
MRRYPSIGGIKTAADFKSLLTDLGLAIPCDEELQTGPTSILAQPIKLDDKTIGNRFCIHPMEGWDGTVDGKPSDATIRRWRNFGLSGAKLIWGGEAVAVRHDGRANPNQLLMSEDNSFSRPNEKTKPEPRILYHHPTLDARVNVDSGYPLLTDGEIRAIIDDFVFASRVAVELGYDFVDIKHCHGYLGHEFLSAHTREGDFGGSFQNRTRFLREITKGVRSVAPGLKIGVRLSAFDLVSFKPDPEQSTPGKMGPGIPDKYDSLLPYKYGFAIAKEHPEQYDLTESVKFLSLLQELQIKLVNITAGSPYYNPHIQRPALYPPSDGYQPPEDPLVGVARQMEATRILKQQFPDLILVGTAYTYLQEFLPFVAQAAVREGWVDSVGLGRMVLSYPELPRDVISGEVLAHKKICRTFSDCTTAPRNGLPSGCYPLDPYYKQSETGVQLKQIKAAKRSNVR